ncbi:MAG: peptidase M23 [Balneolaceae bacterium]|nr:MAG: peptidase M23 [Balneolaceae bacterium]
MQKMTQTIQRFHPLVKTSGPLRHIDLSGGYDPDALKGGDWGVGGYAEARPGMYTSHIFGGRRFIHMGIDIWAPAGTPVYCFCDGTVLGLRDNDNPLDYGPTIVTAHEIDGRELYALHGHLSHECLKRLAPGRQVNAGDVLGDLGTEQENGGWAPHLHFQLSRIKPLVPDMPGVVAPEELEEALQTYPDPRTILGPLY